MYASILALFGILAIPPLASASAPPQARGGKGKPAYFQVGDQVVAHKSAVNAQFLWITGQPSVSTYSSKHTFTLDLPTGSVLTTQMIEHTLYPPLPSGQKAPTSHIATPTTAVSVSLTGVKQGTRALTGGSDTVPSICGYRHCKWRDIHTAPKQPMGGFSDERCCCGGLSYTAAPPRPFW